MPKKIVLVGFDPSYDGDGEIWGVNFAFQTSRVDKIFAMDPLEILEVDEARDNRNHFIKQVNKGDFEIYMQKHFEEIPRSQKFNLKRLRREVRVDDYYTCTAAYMFAEAIRQKPDVILIHGIQTPRDGCWEYVSQKPCLDFWRGFAEGRGIHVEISPGSILGKPFPWQSGKYGYKNLKGEEEAAIVMSAAVHTIKSGNHFRVARELKKHGHVSTRDFIND